jgi:glycosyltransferase involved in cell wall biosynthesis
MRIVYLSYAHMTDIDDHQAWLKRLDFYTRQLEVIASYAEVHSIHLINDNAITVRNNVTYHFLSLKKRKIILPSRLHLYVASLKPDVVMVHGLIFPWQVIWLRFKLGQKVSIVALHHAEKPLRFPKNIVQRIADRYIGAYFFASHELSLPWISNGQIASRNKVHEIMEVSSIFTPFTKLKDMVEVRSTYLWVGRLDTNKDPVTLVKAFTKFLEIFPDVKLNVIYRGGTLKGEMDSVIISNDIPKDSIVLKEDVPHEELKVWYNKADFIISTSHYEGSGTAVCEGMSCGCIPILTNIPSFKMMTAQGNVGLLFNSGDETALLEALKKSKTLDIVKERQKVLQQFQDHLSPEAIAIKIMTAVLSLRKKVS